MASTSSANSIIDYCNQSLSKMSPDGALSTVPSASRSAGVYAVPKKPQRPLTAYHIFFQIEREYIIQTSAGEVADESIYDNKVHLKGVPDRYKNIRLLPDWYAGPGKRKKRKHRKQHGKIGFLELSRAISKRWAELDSVDPETKEFVQEIAKKEIEVYYREMKEYKEKTGGTLQDVKPSSPSRPKKKAKKSQIRGAPPLQMLQRQPFLSLPEVMLSMQMKFELQMQQTVKLNSSPDMVCSQITSSPEMIVSSTSNQAVKDLIQPPARVQAQSNIEHIKPEIGDLKLCMPVNDASSRMSPKSVGVDIVDIGDDEIMNLWKSQN